jgi:hypothetical protein
MNNKAKKPTQQQTPPIVPIKTWFDLYNAALEFHMLKPYKILSEEDIFGVYDPYRKQMGYACITGALGVMIGIALYRGDQGYKLLRQTLD